MIMKKIFAAILLASTFIGCKQNKTVAPNTNIVTVDTSSLYNNSIQTDKSQGTALGSAVKAAPKPVSQQRATSENNVTKTSSANNGSGNTAAAPATEKKKGWSHKAKGAAVGAGTGAITGALINKNNRGVGALIGGVVGAASGYIIGNEVDKKKNKKP
jgi:hypothetical protein